MKRVFVFGAICFFLLSLVESFPIGAEKQQEKKIVTAVTKEMKVKGKTVKIGIISTSAQMRELQTKLKKTKLAKTKDDMLIKGLEKKLAKMKKDRSRTPWIKLDPSNSMGANYTDTIVWCSESPFAIHFGPNSPVNGLVFRSKFCEESKCHKVKAKVVHDPSIKGGIRNKYIVALFDEVEGTVEIIDPDLEIPPRGGGPEE